MFKLDKFYILFVGLIILPIWLSAETGTLTPYSRYGYGMLKEPSFGNSRGMGGIGYGLRSNRQINPMNPASYSSTDSMTFICDVGASGYGMILTEGGTSKSGFNGSFDYIAIQFPAFKWWGISVGLIPFSSVGYNYSSSDPTFDVNKSYIGSGGLSELYFGSSFKIFNRLSLGFNIGYLFGNISHLNGASIGANHEGQTLFTNIVRVNDYKLDFGLQYTQPIGEKHKVTIGGVYSYQRPLNTELYMSFTSQTADTLLEYSIGGKFELPHMAGGGITYEYNNQLTVGFDAKWEGWSKAAYNPHFTPGQGIGDTANVANKFTDKYRFALGAEFIPKPLGRSYGENIRYRIGGYYSTSYVSIWDQSMKGFQGLYEYGVTLGLGFPLKGIKSMLNLGLEYKRVDSFRGNLIKEDYFIVSLNFTFAETWFFKRHFE